MKGLFLSQDPAGMVDGHSLYRLYALIDSMDPFGKYDLFDCLSDCEKTFNKSGKKDPATRINLGQCRSRCANGMPGTPYDVKAPDIISYLENFIPTDLAAGCYSLSADLGWAKVYTPYGTLSPTIGASMCISQCENEDGTKGKMARVQVSVGGKGCIGIDGKNPFKDKVPKWKKTKLSDPSISISGIPKCKTSRFEGEDSISVKIEGKAGALISGSASLSMKVYPEVKAPSYSYSIKCGLYAGAEVCAGLSGSVKFDTVIDDGKGKK